MKTENKVVSNAKATLEKVIVALCKYPQLLQVDFYEHEAIVQVHIIAHPTDSRILVGTGGSHISALSNLARLLFYGSKKLVQIMPIESLEHQKEHPFQRFKPKKDWNGDFIQELAGEIVGQVFPYADTWVEMLDENERSIRLKIFVKPTQNAAVSKKLESSLAILFVPIGTNAGRMVYASLTMC